MKVLLDSHVLLWMIFDPERLPLSVMGVLRDESNELHVSIVSIWELAVKVGIGKLTLPNASTRYLVQQLPLIGAQLLTVTEAHIFALEALPSLQQHKDPWDRMLVAQAIEEGMTLLTSDKKMSAYGARIMWQ